MSDVAYQNALVKLKEIQARLLDLQEKLHELKEDRARVEQFIADWKNFAGIKSPEPVAAPAQGKFINPARELVGDVAEKIIRRIGHPISRDGLFKELQRDDVSIVGKNPEMVLSTMMWRMQDRFVRIPRHGYWLRDRPYPAADYKPGDIPDTRKTGGAEKDYVDANDNADQDEDMFK